MRLFVQVLILSSILWISCTNQNEQIDSQALIEYLHDRNQQELSALVENSSNLFKNGNFRLIISEIKQLDSIQALSTKLIKSHISYEGMDDQVSSLLEKEIEEIVEHLKKNFNEVPEDFIFPFKVISYEEQTKLKLLTIVQLLIDNAEQKFWQAFLRQIDQSTEVVVLPKSISKDSLQYHIQLTRYESGVRPKFRLSGKGIGNYRSVAGYEVKLAKKDLESSRCSVEIFLPKLAGGGGYSKINIELDGKINESYSIPNLSTP
ncbi:MAG: hypothetical protein AAF694_13720 [Bacteroidota bacterium]